MTIIDERQEQILDFIIRDYIRHGAPVASQRIYDKSRVDVAPATIRNIMVQLDDDGYLEKSHMSGGRTPTDKAYRYFVDSLIEIKPLKKREADIFEDLANSLILESLAQDIGKMMASRSKFFTVLADFGDKKDIGFYGLGQLLDEPEFSDKKLLGDFARIFDNLYDVIDIYRQEMGGKERAFIGKENPIKDTKELSVLSARLNNKKSDIVMLVIGPRRMDYEYGCSVLRNFIGS